MIFEMDSLAKGSLRRHFRWMTVEGSVVFIHLQVARNRHIPSTALLWFSGVYILHTLSRTEGFVLVKYVKVNSLDVGKRHCYSNISLTSAVLI